MSNFNSVEPFSVGVPFTLDSAMTGQIAETIIRTIEFAGLRERLRTRLEEIDKDYTKLDDSENKQLKEREFHRFFTQEIIKSLIENGQYDKILPIFQSYMNGSPNFIEKVTEIIIARITHRDSY